MAELIVEQSDSPKYIDCQSAWMQIILISMNRLQLVNIWKGESSLWASTLSFLPGCTSLNVVQIASVFPISLLDFQPFIYFILI